jgi:hypothetical protein
MRVSGHRPRRLQRQPHADAAHQGSGRYRRTATRVERERCLAPAPTPLRYELRASTALSRQHRPKRNSWAGSCRSLPLGSNRWQTLAEAETPAISRRADAVPGHPRSAPSFDNGLYQLRLTAWDLAGRSSEIASPTDHRQRQQDFRQPQPGRRHADPGWPQPWRFARHWREPPSGGTPADRSDGDFGNWTLPLLASQLSSDQPASLANGAIGAVVAEARASG